MAIVVHAVVVVVVAITAGTLRVCLVADGRRTLIIAVFFVFGGASQVSGRQTLIDAVAPLIQFHPEHATVDVRRLPTLETLSTHERAAVNERKMVWDYMYDYM